MSPKSIFFLFFGALLTFSACQKEAKSDFLYGIDPATEKDLLCKSLRLLGNNVEGDMPVGFDLGNSVLVDVPQAVEISAGVLLYIPYQVTSVDSICALYLQVVGADNYWEAGLTVDPTSQQPYFEILIPKFVLEGFFEFTFSVEDCNGVISPALNTGATISPIADCDTWISGSVGITVRTFDLGEEAGTASFLYEMYSIPDRLDLRYNGQWVASTGTPFSPSVVIPDCSGNNTDGFVSGFGALEVNYDPDISRIVEVYVSGCNAGTQWDISVNCP